MLQPQEPRWKRQRTAERARLISRRRRLQEQRAGAGGERAVAVGMDWEAEVEESVEVKAVDTEATASKVRAVGQEG